MSRQRGKNLPKAIKHFLCRCSYEGKPYFVAMEELKEHCQTEKTEVPDIKETYYKSIKGYIKHWIRHPQGPEQAMFEHAYVKTRSLKGTKDWIDSLNQQNVWR